MLGIMRAGQRDRDEREYARRVAAWRRSITEKYNMPDDLSSHRDTFCLQILKELPSEKIAEALVDMHHGVDARKRRTLRCWIYGCVAQDRCTFHPYCTDCQGRCTRCGIPVMPRAAARALATTAAEPSSGVPTSEGSADPSRRGSWTDCD